MAKSRQQFSSQDSLMSSPAGRSREWEGPSRWTEYLGPQMTPPTTSRSSRNPGPDGQVQGSGGSQKGLNMKWVVQLTEVAEGLMAKMYRLNQILDYPDPVGHIFSEAFWKAGVFPNYPKICILLSKKFPEHFSKLQLERVRIDFLPLSMLGIFFVITYAVLVVLSFRMMLVQVDRFALDALHDIAELQLQSLEPWVQVYSWYLCLLNFSLFSFIMCMFESKRAAINLHGFSPKSQNICQCMKS